MKPLFTLAFLWATASTAGPAAQQHLTIEGVKGVVFKAGETKEAVVEAKVREKFHVQANPASKPTLIATKVDLVGNAAFLVDRPIYPKAKPYKIEGLGMSVDTYDGRFEVKVPIKAGSSAKTGKTTLEGKIRYQACDDKVCFPPTFAKFSVPVEVQP